MRVLVLAAALLAAPVLADPVATHQNGDSVRLTTRECPKAILEKIDPTYHPHYMLADAFVSGAKWQACWRFIPQQGSVHLVYSDGDQGLIPHRAFAEQPTV